ncbi:CLUMA_CG006552, isoform A [Clunio marinus]|uniref:CLUMA_CG006552, isoform A n=1 Tax=Clunio marinus TaxID=568069 RepID=A0A1J1HZZ4_9DIPT|nr:CLUMA_CG006552, isoform A [Clunio marinus]
MARLFVYFTFLATLTQALGTTTNDLLRSQEELTIGHEFFEMNVVNSREDLSGFIYRDSGLFLNVHLEAFGSMKSISLETTEALNELLPTSSESERCLDQVKDRWRLQITRFGSGLSRCLAAVNRRFFVLDAHLNTIHSIGHLTSNQVPNQGIAVLSEVNNFSGPWEVPRMINRRFRQVLSATRPYMDFYTEFLRVVDEGSEAAFERLTQCDRELVEDFQTQAAEDLERAHDCLA